MSSVFAGKRAAASVVFRCFSRQANRNRAQSFLPKGEMQKMEMIEDANISKFKSEIQSSPELGFAPLKWETEELRFDRDEATNTMDHLQKTYGWKIDKSIDALRAEIDATNLVIMRCSIGLSFCMAAFGLAFGLAFGQAFVRRQ